MSTTGRGRGLAYSNSLRSESPASRSAKRARPMTAPGEREAKRKYSGVIATSSVAIRSVVIASSFERAEPRVRGGREARPQEGGVLGGHRLHVRVGPDDLLLDRDPVRPDDHQDLGLRDAGRHRLQRVGEGPHGHLLRTDDQQGLEPGDRPLQRGSPCRPRVGRGARRSRARPAARGPARCRAPRRAPAGRPPRPGPPAPAAGTAPPASTRRRASRLRRGRHPPARSGAGPAVRPRAPAAPPPRRPSLPAVDRSSRQRGSRRLVRPRLRPVAERSGGSARGRTPRRTPLAGATGPPGAWCCRRRQAPRGTDGFDRRFHARWSGSESRSRPGRRRGQGRRLRRSLGPWSPVARHVDPDRRRQLSRVLVVGPCRLRRRGPGPRRGPVRAPGGAAAAGFGAGGACGAPQPRLERGDLALELPVARRHLQRRLQLHERRAQLAQRLERLAQEAARQDVVGRLAQRPLQLDPRPCGVAGVQERPPERQPGRGVGGVQDEPGPRHADGFRVLPRLAVLLRQLREQPRPWVALEPASELVDAGVSHGQKAPGPACARAGPVSGHTCARPRVSPLEDLDGPFEEARRVDAVGAHEHRDRPEAGPRDVDDVRHPVAGRSPSRCRSGPDRRRSMKPRARATPSPSWAK